MMSSLCLTSSYFFFRQKIITKICLEQMFMSGSNIREAADLKDVSLPQGRDLKPLGWFVDLYW